MGVIRLLAVFLLCFLWDNVKAQLVCQQHVMTSATATENTQFSYTMCDGTPNTLNFIPGFTTIQCAVVGSVSVVSGDGWWDGIVQTADLLILLQYYGQPCE